MWIHEQADWAQFYWDDASLSTALAAVRHQQGWLLGKMQGLGFSLQLETSLDTLTNDVVKSSAIEGERLNREEVRSSIARKLGIESGGRLPSSRHVDGIVEILLDATQACQMPLTEERLCAWHCALFPSGFSGMTPIMVGMWRPPSAGAMQVISGKYGRTHVHFEAPDAQRLAAEMADFLVWFEACDSLDPIIKAGIAHFWFITLHPFEDGNGRIARAIVDMVLARAEQTSQRFYSLSTQIEAERKQYYEELERQQRGTLDLTLWLLWFIGCLGRAMSSAEHALQAVLHKGKIWERLQSYTVNKRQRTVLNRMMSGDFEGYMNTAKYAKLAKCSTDSALRDINALVEWGVLLKNPAQGRSTSYRLIDEFY